MMGNWSEEELRLRSAKHDAERVIETLEQAKRQAAPLRDPGLTKQIDDAAEHVRRRSDPKRGG